MYGWSIGCDDKNTFALLELATMASNVALKNANKRIQMPALGVALIVRSGVPEGGQTFIRTSHLLSRGQ
jgi:hypothetical protein